ncbi:MAG: archease [Chitinispirillales bacterium]|jgi:SHS2 domain-containing protein|nr:archease [Chitinispirillales bacterium]
MPYEYLEDVAMADVAFHAWGRTFDGLLCAAGDAMLGVMVENPLRVEPATLRKIAAEGGTEEMLLYSLLEELLYQKDVSGLLLRLVAGGEIRERSGILSYEGVAAGEPVNADRHNIAVDVKAVTMHMFSLYRKEDSWHCTVVLDT